MSIQSPNVIGFPSKFKHDVVKQIVRDAVGDDIPFAALDNNDAGSCPGYGRELVESTATVPETSVAVRCGAVGGL